MVIGILHRVVWYFVVQKVTKPVVDHYLNSSTHQTLNLHFECKISDINLSKSVHQLQTKGAYTVMGCPLPLVIAKSKGFNRKISNTASVRQPGKVEERE